MILHCFCRKWALSLLSVSHAPMAERPFTRNGRTYRKSHTQRSWAGVNSDRIIQSQTLHCFIFNAWVRIQEMDWCVSSIPAQTRSDKLSLPLTTHHSIFNSANLTVEKRVRVDRAQQFSSPF